MTSFENIGSALQLLGCEPIQVGPKWLRPTPKRRAVNSALQRAQSVDAPLDLEASADPYQLLDEHESANQPPALPEIAPTTSESSFEVVHGSEPVAEGFPVGSMGAALSAGPAVSSERVEVLRHAILPVASSQVPGTPLPLGQQTIARPVVAPSIPRLSDPSRRPKSLRLPSLPAIRSNIRPRFTSHSPTFVPLPRPVPLRAADYHRPRPLLPWRESHGFLEAKQDAGTPAGSTLPQKFAPPTRVGQKSTHTTTPGVCLQQDMHAKVLADAFKLWGKLRPLLQDSSEVLQDLDQSCHAQELERRLLTGVSENTLLRYLQCLASFLSALGSLGLGMHNSLTQVHIADSLLVMHREGDHVTNGLKAIRWAAKTLLLRLPNLYDGIMRSVSTMVTSDRKEALPLTAWIISSLELELLLEKGPVGRRIFIGACVWASLRFSDSQHVKWDEILVSGWCMRSTCFRTKTSRRGVPFGVISWGIFGDQSCVLKTWVGKYLQLLGEEWDRMESNLGVFVPDCLFFTSNEEEFCPLSYGQVLSSFRGLLVQLGVPLGEASRFSLHSMKVTLLSMLSQLGESESSRAAQGHHAHRESFSVKLYSRDDVWQALHCQAQAANKLRSGWVPSTAQGRGGRMPVPQQAFIHLRSEWGDWKPATEHPRFPFAIADSMPAQVTILAAGSAASPKATAVDEGAHPVGDSSSSEEPSEESPYHECRKRKSTVQAVADFDEFLWIRSGTGVLHLAIKADGVSPVQDPNSGLFLKPCCGCRLRSAELVEPVKGARFCMHAACNRF